MTNPKGSALNLETLNKVINRLDTLYTKVAKLNVELGAINRKKLNITASKATLKSAQAVNQLSNAITKLSKVDASPEKSFNKIIDFINRIAEASSDKDLLKGVEDFGSALRSITKVMPVLSNFKGVNSETLKSIESILLIFSKAFSLGKDMPKEQGLVQGGFDKKISYIASIVKSLSDIVEKVDKLKFNPSSILKFKMVVGTLSSIMKSVSKLSSEVRVKNLQGISGLIGSLQRVFKEMVSVGGHETSKDALKSFIAKLAAFVVIGRVMRIALKPIVSLVKGKNAEAIGGLGQIASALSSFMDTVATIAPNVKSMGFFEFFKVSGRITKLLKTFSKGIRPALKSIKNIDSKSLEYLGKLFDAINRLLKLSIESIGAKDMEKASKSAAKAVKRIIGAVPSEKNVNGLRLLATSLMGLSSAFKRFFSGVDRSNLLFAGQLMSKLTDAAIVSALVLRLSSAIKSLAKSLLMLTSGGYAVSFFKRVSQAIKDTGQALRNVGRGLIDFGSNLNQMAGLPKLMQSSAFNAATEFEKTGTLLQVFGGLNDEARAKAESFANEIGRKYPLSANEALNATLDLIKAGQDLSSVEFILPSAADLAALSDNGSIEEATRTLIASSSAFSRFTQDVEGTFENISVASDIISAGADISTASVESIGQGLANVGASAESFGMTMEETVAILAIFDQNAIKGAEGGTALRSLLNALGRPQTINALRNLGISMFEVVDGVEQRRSLNDIITDIGSALDGMPDSRKAAVLQTLADTFGRQGLNVLLNQGADGIDEYVGSMGEVAPASERAAQALDNFKGDITQLKGSFETLLTSVIVPTLETFFRPMAQAALLVVNSLLELDTSVHRFMGTGAVLMASIFTVIAAFSVLSGSLIGATGLFVSFLGVLANIPFLITGIIGVAGSMISGLLLIAGAAAVLLPIIMLLTHGFMSLFDIFKNDKRVRIAVEGLFVNLKGTINDLIMPFRSFINLIKEFFTFGNSADGLFSASDSIKSFIVSLSNTMRTGFIGELRKRARDLSVFFETLTFSIGKFERLKSIGSADSVHDLRKFVFRFLSVNKHLSDGMSNKEMFRLSTNISKYSIMISDFRDSLKRNLSRFKVDIEATGISSAFSLLRLRLETDNKELIETVINGVKSFVQTLRDAIFVNKDMLKDAFIKMMSILFSPLGVAGFFSRLFGASGVSDFISALQNLLNDAFGGIFDFVLDLLEGKSIEEAFDNAFGETAFSGLLKLLQEVGRSVSYVFDMITGFLSFLFNSSGVTTQGLTVSTFVEGAIATFTRLFEVLNTYILGPLSEGRFMEVLSNIRKFFSYLFGRLIVAVRDTLGAFLMGKIRDAIKTLSVYLPLLIGNISDSVRDFFESGRATELLNRLSETFQTVLQQTIGSIFSGARGGLSLVSNSFGFDFSSLIGTIDAILVRGLSRESLALGYFPLLTNTVLTAFQTAVSTIFTGMETFLGLDLEASKNNVTNALTGLMDSINLAFLGSEDQPAIFDSITTILDSLNNGLTGFFSIFRDLIPDIPELSIPIFDDLLDSVSSFVSGLETAIQDVPAFQTVFSGIENFISNMSLLLPQLPDFTVSNPIRIIAESLIYLVTNLFAFGVDTITILLDTIREFFEFLASPEVANFLGKIRDIFNLALAIGALILAVTGLGIALGFLVAGINALTGASVASSFVEVTTGLTNVADAAGDVSTKGGGVNRFFRGFRGLARTVGTKLVSLGSSIVAFGSKLYGLAKPFIVPIVGFLALRSALENVEDFLDSVRSLLDGDLASSLSNFSSFLLNTFVDLGLSVFELFGLDTEELERNLETTIMQIEFLIRRTFNLIGLELRRVIDEQLALIDVAILRLQVSASQNLFNRDDRGLGFINEFFGSDDLEGTKTIQDFLTEAATRGVDESFLQRFADANVKKITDAYRSSFEDNGTFDISELALLGAGNLDVFDQVINDMLMNGDMGMLSAFSEAIANAPSDLVDDSVITGLIDQVNTAIEQGLLLEESGTNVLDTLILALSKRGVSQEVIDELTTAITDTVEDAVDSALPDGESVKYELTEIDVVPSDDGVIVDTSAIDDDPAIVDGFSASFNLDTISSVEDVEDMSEGVADLRTKLLLLKHDLEEVPVYSEPALTSLSSVDGVFLSILDTVQKLTNNLFLFGSQMLLLPIPLTPATVGINLLKDSFSGLHQVISDTRSELQQLVNTMLSMPTKVGGEGGGVTPDGGRAIGGPTIPGGMYEILERGSSEMFYENGRAYLLSSGRGKVEPLSNMPRFDLSASSGMRLQNASQAPITNSTSNSTINQGGVTININGNADSSTVRDIRRVVQQEIREQTRRVKLDQRRFR